MRTRTGKQTEEQGAVFAPAADADVKRRADMAIPYAGLFVAVGSLALIAYLGVRLGSVTIAASDTARHQAMQETLAKKEARLKLLEEFRASLSDVLAAQAAVNAADKELAEGQEITTKLENALDEALSATKSAKGKDAVKKAKADFNELKNEAVAKFEELGERAEALAKIQENARVKILEGMMKVKFIPDAEPPAAERKVAAEKPAAEKTTKGAKETAPPVEKTDGGKAVEE